MRFHWTLMFVAAFGLAPCCWSADKAADKAAEDKAEDVFYGNRMIVSALEAEVKGDFASRERLLKEAAALEAAPVAQAHLGLINVGEKKPEWRTIDESIAAAAKDDNLQRYEKRRAQSPDTADGHLTMAKWCLGRNMDAQARAHLARLLEFMPDHAGAREALGYVRLGDKWLSPAEIERMQLNAAAKTKSIEKHGKTLAGWIEKMKSKNAKERESALADFRAYKEPTAVGAVEAILNTPDEPTTKLLIEWMGQVDCYESSLVLARYSLLHPDDALRTLAMEKLVNRPLHDFVPQMLEMLSSPIAIMVQPSYDSRGRLTGYRQAFGREGMDDKNIQIFEKQIQRVSSPALGRDWGSIRLRTLTALVNAEYDERAQQDAMLDMQLRQLEMERQNALIKQVNERIAKVVAKVSGRVLTEKADVMWKWWDEYNETEYQKYKPERYKKSYYSYSIPEHRISSCFAAGTLVMTQTGPMAIEKIQAGDLVLNKNLQTGELHWRPVLKATVRAPFATVSVRIDDETLRCTTGHLFWVSGFGWKKANELKPGDILHGAKTPARVTFVEAQPAIPTYNLEVADSPNYFVGKNLLLTHDVTPLESNHQTFPGQEMVRQLSEQRPVRKTASR